LSYLRGVKKREEGMMSDPTMPMPDDPDMPGRTVEDPPMPEDRLDQSGFDDDEADSTSGGMPQP
jgi:hypothetical protein